ncbi:uncharacterized protein LOC106051555 [Biomphalaria glabrata]|uniref:Uncharacterized protein LOC106051555 n=1 Tax=Biomphalaria glabrata TaxID=6526 RepID=A0A9U8DVQ2_BIOGL|nr:uncharacterized protein LOC106051555 [Biomphalaria glabrata]
MKKIVFNILNTKSKSLIFSRPKKYYASLHNVSKCIFLFPNTPLSYIRFPKDLKIFKKLSDFKIKSITGGFQRRPELLINSSKTHLNKCVTSNSTCTGHISKRKLIQNQRIQHELISMALKLSNDIVKCNSSQVDFNSPANVNLLPLMVLDVGCGDGMSMMPLLNLGHHCVGVDIKLQSLVGFKNDLDDKECLLNIQNNVSLWSQTMTINANSKLIGNEKDKLNMCNSSMFDLVRWDLRYGLPFKENSFDLVISVSFLQWLFYGSWQKQLESFFGSLRNVVAPEGKIVIQFYPASVNQVENTIDIAMKYFKGVLVGDYPHIDRGRKLFLILF